jgi:fructose-1-phosphate kinase PfkB-like protein
MILHRYFNHASWIGSIPPKMDLMNIIVEGDSLVAGIFQAELKQWDRQKSLRLRQP